MRRQLPRALATVVAVSWLLASNARADGPASGVAADPTPPPPPPPTPAIPAPLPTARGSVGPFPVTFATGERRLELLEVTHPPPRPEDGASADRRAHYTTLCLGTCTKPLAAGGHEFGLRRPDGKAVLAGTLDLTGPVTLGATYQSHAGRRVLGLPVLIAGIGGGIGLFTAASEATTSTAEGGEFAGGAVLVAVGIAGAYLLMTKGDEGHVFVAPLSAAAPLTPGAPAALPTAQGASLGLRF